ncbi:MAG: DNA-3-methyladenine glycosylase family protein [Thermodesulfobacteriota bacterium]
MSGSIRIWPFSLKDTLESGQFFRFTKVDESYLVQSHGQIFILTQKDSHLLFEGTEREFLIQFLRLEEDLSQILKEIDRDPIIHQAILRYSGMRLIRQDPWECLLSFLCSSAKTIHHIRSIIELLCKSSGKKIFLGNFIGYEFPDPQKLKDGRPLESIGAGFRKNYLIEASKSIDRNKLLTLKELSYQEARRSLMDLTGVGKKIADCVLLYSLDFLESFPIDTWIKKGLQKFYFKGKRVGEQEMEKFVSNHFGPYAGYAQLYLYHFWRNNPPLP